MTLDQYNEAVKQIFAEQQSIAQQTAQLALTGAAHPGSPGFVDLMNRQWALVQQLSKLNSDAMSGIGK